MRIADAINTFTLRFAVLGALHTSLHVMQVVLILASEMMEKLR